MEKTVIEIKLTQVNFVPTTYTVDSEGKLLTAKRTVVGQLAFDCEFLPEDLRSQLEDLIRQEYAKPVPA
jgi:hypothetical protein